MGDLVGLEMLSSVEGRMLGRREGEPQAFCTGLGVVLMTCLTWGGFVGVDSEGTGGHTPAPLRGEGVGCGVPMRGGGV